MTTLFKRSVTAWAVRDQVDESIGFHPIAFELAPRSLMMNVKRPSQFRLLSTAILAGIVIALASGFALATPIGAAPFFVTALPIAMILCLLPLCSAFIGAEAFVLPALNNVRSDLQCFPTTSTGQHPMASPHPALFRAGDIFGRAEYVELGLARADWWVENMIDVEKQLALPLPLPAPKPTAPLAEQPTIF